MKVIKIGEITETRLMDGCIKVHFRYDIFV